jgi:hypothetical protein
MAGLLFAFGVIFVGFGVMGWIGLLTAPAPPGRAGASWPSAIQETPIFLAIGFGFALIAAGAIVDRLDRLLKVLTPANAVQPGAGRTDRTVAGLPEIAAPEATARAEAEQRALAARGWTVEIGKNGRWRATGKSGTVNFESEREKRDWIESELAQRP